MSEYNIMYYELNIKYAYEYQKKTFKWMPISRDVMTSGVFQVAISGAKKIIHKKIDVTRMQWTTTIISNFIISADYYYVW